MAWTDAVFVVKDIIVICRKNEFMDFMQYTSGPGITMPPLS